MVILVLLYRQISCSKARLVRSYSLAMTFGFIYTFTGTGKTSVARHFGSIYFDMGILSGKEVIDCSASDLVASYIGQTGPKVRRLLDQALGKVCI